MREQLPRGMCMWVPLVVGLSHHTAPLEVRERAAFTRGELKDALAALKGEVGGGVILSTCNRTEVYTLAPNGREYPHKLVRFLGQHRPIAGEELSRYLYAYGPQEAVRHLFRVTSGLDSMLLGDSQILGQVRDAYGTSLACGCVSGPLDKLFHRALRVGKRVRRETGISQNALSVGHAAVELAREVLDDLRGRRVMVVGAGEAGGLVAHALGRKGASRIVVVNRTPERAKGLAGELGAEAASFNELESLLTSVDIVVSATDAQETLIPLDLMKRVMAARQGAPLFLVDIAVPRDVDPEVATLDKVSLFDLDDLEAVSCAHRMERQKDAARAEEIVEQETGQFMEWLASLEVTPTIAALREQAEAVRRQEVHKTLKRMPHLSPQDVDRVEALSSALVSKLLHHPVAASRRARARSTCNLPESSFNSIAQSHKERPGYQCKSDFFRVSDVFEKSPAAGERRRIA